MLWLQVVVSVCFEYVCCCYPVTSPERAKQTLHCKVQIQDFNNWSIRASSGCFSCFEYVCCWNPTTALTSWIPGGKRSSPSVGASSGFSLFCVFSVLSVGNLSDSFPLGKESNLVLVEENNNQGVIDSSMFQYVLSMFVGWNHAHVTAAVGQNPRPSSSQNNIHAEYCVWL